MEKLERIVKILKTDFVTHDVKRFVLIKPEDLEFVSGQAAHISINEGKWKSEERPFTFTSLNEDLVLEFIIKGYPEHKGVTQKLHSLASGDELILKDVFGTINYKGKGTFIAGGAGITPFIAILRQLRREGSLEGNRLFFSNKKEEDIILEKEFKDMFKENSADLVLTLTEESKEGYENKLIDKNFIEKYIKDFNQNFYLCGPPKMVEDLTEVLKDLGAGVDSLVFEGKK